MSPLLIELFNLKMLKKGVEDGCAKL